MAGTPQDHLKFHSLLSMHGPELDSAYRLNGKRRNGGEERQRGKNEGGREEYIKQACLQLPAPAPGPRFKDSLSVSTYIQLRKTEMELKNIRVYYER